MQVRSIYLGLFFLIFGACQTVSPDADTGPNLEIIAEAGSMPNADWDYLPYPAHYGKFGDLNVLLLSKAPHIGNTRSIQPVGMLVVGIGSQTEKWVIANDAHADFAISNLSEVNDLMTNHNGIKSTLERWITNRKDLGHIILKGWEAAPELINDNQ